MQVLGGLAEYVKLCKVIFFVVDKKKLCQRGFKIDALSLSGAFMVVISSYISTIICVFE